MSFTCISMCLDGLFRDPLNGYQTQAELQFHVESTLVYRGKMTENVSLSKNLWTYLCVASVISHGRYPCRYSCWSCRKKEQQFAQAHL